MKTMKLLIALLALMHTTDANTEYQPIAKGSILPEFIGAPCSTRTDIEEGTCTLRVRTPKKWK